MTNQTQTLPSFDDNYWRKNYNSRPTGENECYEDYQLAYQIGHEGYDRYFNKSFDEVETELKRDYEAMSAQTGKKGLDWDQVRESVRDAWDQAGTT